MRHCVFFLVLLASQSAAAQTSYKWTGGASGSWQTPTNWTPQGVPGAADNALFETSADVTLAADTRVDRLEARGIPSNGSPFPTIPPTTPTVTVSSAVNRFLSVGAAYASRGTLTVTARVDTCGSTGTGTSSTDNPAGQIALQNVGGIGLVGGGGRGVSVSGAALRIGGIIATGGPMTISGTVLRVGNVTAARRSTREGAAILVITSTPVPGGTTFGDFSFPSGPGTIDLRIADVTIGRISNVDEGFDNGDATVRVQNASVTEISTGDGYAIFNVGGTLRLGRAGGQVAGSLSFSATQAGSALVFGAQASVVSPARISRPIGLGNGMNLRIDGPTLIDTGGRFQLSGGAFTVSPGARLRLESSLFEITGSGTFGVDGELSIAPAGSSSGAPRAVTVSVPTRLAGLLTVDLSTVTPGDASRVSFAGLTAGGALAFTYPGGVAPYPLGTTFTPFTYTSVTGAFNPVTFPALQGNTAWAFTLEPTRARLAVVLGQAPNPVPDDVATDEDIPVSFDPGFERHLHERRATDDGRHRRVVTRVGHARQWNRHVHAEPERLWSGDAGLYRPGGQRARIDRPGASCCSTGQRRPRRGGRCGFDPGGRLGPDRCARQRHRCRRAGAPDRVGRGPGGRERVPERGARAVLPAGRVYGDGHVQVRRNRRDAFRRGAGDGCRSPVYLVRACTRGGVGLAASPEPVGGHGRRPGLAPSVSPRDRRRVRRARPARPTGRAERARGRRPRRRARVWSPTGGVRLPRPRRG